MKTVIITGASSGIGEKTAIKLKKAGFNVVGTYNLGYENAKLIENKYGVDFVKCDLEIPDSIDSVFDFAVKKYGKVDIVIANAGLALAQKLLIDCDKNEIERVIDVNVKGTIYTNRKALSLMLNGGGKIINVSSIFGLKGGSCEAVYSASKFAVIGLTQALAEEMQFSQVEVCAIALGLIDTPMNSHLSAEDKLEFVKDAGLNNLPTGDDVAEKIYEILTQHQSINGKIYKLFC